MIWVTQFDLFSGSWCLLISGSCTYVSGLRLCGSCCLQLFRWQLGLGNLCMYQVIYLNGTSRCLSVTNDIANTKAPYVISRKTHWQSRCVTSHICILSAILILGACQ